MPAILMAATLLGADSEVSFVPPPNRVSVRELRIPQKAKDKYADAESRVRKHDSEGARKKLQEAIALAPEFSAAWNGMGVLATEPAEAERFFGRAIETDPDNIDAMLNLGALLLKSGRAEQALPYHRRAALSLPGDVTAQAQYAMNLYQLGKLAEAERGFLSTKHLDTAGEQMPQLFLAEIYARRGEKDRAVAELEELLARRPAADLAATVRAAIARLR
jgi:Tfp pilus assembly protein PilF